MRTNAYGGSCMSAGATGRRPRRVGANYKRAQYDQFVAYDPFAQAAGGGRCSMADLWFVLLTVGLFAVFALVAKAVERL
jgi:hypothetical protein